MKCHEINIPDGMDEATLHAILTGELGSRDRIPDRHFLAEAGRLGRAMPVLEKEQGETGYQSIAAVPRLFRGHVDLSRISETRRRELEAMGFGFVPSDTPVRSCLSRAQTFSGAYTSWASSFPLMAILNGGMGLGASDVRNIDYTALSSPSADQDATGTGVVICAIDGGIDTDHASLTGRFTGIHTEHTDYEDGAGHGTAMAGLMVSDEYGLAPAATLELYRWSSNSDTGTTTNVNNCLGAVATQDALDSSTKRVCVMPLEVTAGTNPFTAGLTAVQALGIPICVAAGNQGTGTGVGGPLDAISHVWPAESGLNFAGTTGVVMTATACNHLFTKHIYTNFGPLTNILVPCMQCRTTKNDGTTEITFGASSAASVFAGAVHALLLESESKPANAAGVLALHRMILDMADHVDVNGYDLSGAHHSTAQYTKAGVTKTAVLRWNPS